MKRIKLFLAAGLAAVMVCCLFKPQPSATADEISDIQQEIAGYEEKKKEIEESIKKLEEKKSDMLAYIEELDKQLNSLEEDIEKLEGEITTLTAALEVTKEELAVAKKKETDQYNAMLSRIKYNYENGDSSYLSLLFEAESVVDFLNNAEYAKQMAEFDKNMYENYKQAKEEVAKKEAEQEAQLKQLNGAKEAQEYEKKSVERLISDKTAEIDKYNNELVASQQEKEEFDEKIEAGEAEVDRLIEEARQKAIEEERRRKEEERKRKEEEERKKREEEEKKKQEAEQNGEKPSEDDKVDDEKDEPSEDSDDDNSDESFIWPLPASGRITSYFGPRKSPTAGASSNHRGIDIGAPSGSSILAAKGGQVIAAGYHYSMGNYVQIYHGDGVCTIYMHASKLLVSAGTTVKQGDVIARVGSTGVSTGPHLHFGVKIGDSYVNPLKYVSY